MSDGVSEVEMMGYVADIVSAHVSNNSVAREAVAELIRSVREALEVAVKGEPAVPLVPAVPINRSVFPDYLVCLEDGRKLRMLKRHLLASYGLTPEGYRKRWGLPWDYPMVSPNYSAHRTALAKQLGLGRKPSHPVEAEARVQRVAEGVSGKRAARRLKESAG